MSGRDDGGLIGYNPERVQTLTAKTAAAAADLDAAPLDDPAASEARRLIRAISFALSTRWLPVLSRLGGDTSMTAWGAGGPAAAGPGGSGLRATSTETPATTDELLDLAGRAAGGEPDAIAALTAALADDELLAALLEALGPQGVFELIGGLAFHGNRPYGATYAHVDDRHALAARLRDGLGLVGEEEGFDADTFAGAAMSLYDEFEPGYAAFVIGFVLDGDWELGDRAAAVGARLLEHERAGADLGGGFGAYGGPFLAISDRLSGASGDPLVAVLYALESDPEASRQLLGDADAMYQLVSREWRDGGSALVVASAAATTGPDLTDTAHPPDADTIATVNRIVGQTVNGLGGGDHYDPGKLTERASVAAADIVGVHAAAFDNAVQNDRRPIGDEHLRQPTTAIHYEDAFGDGSSVAVAYLGVDAAAGFIQRAGASEAGQDRLAFGVGNYQAELAAGTAAQVAASPSWGSDRLGRQLTQSAQFEGFVASEIGRGAQRAGREHDEAITGFIGGVGFVATQVPVVGDAIGTIDTGVGWLAGYNGKLSSGLAGDFAQNEAAMIAWAEDYSTAAVEGLQLTYLNAFVAEGLIDTPPLDDSLLFESGGIMLVDPVAWAEASGPDSELGNWLANSPPIIAGGGGEDLVLNPYHIEEGFKLVQFGSYIDE